MSWGLGVSQHLDPNGSRSGFGRYQLVQLDNGCTDHRMQLQPQAILTWKLPSTTSVVVSDNSTCGVAPICGVQLRFEAAVDDGSASSTG